MVKAHRKKKLANYTPNHHGLDLVLEDLVRRRALVLNDGIYRIGESEAVEEAVHAYGDGFDGFAE